MCGCLLDVCAAVMSSKRKTSAPTRVLVDTDTCAPGSATADRDSTSLTSSVPPVDDDYDSDQSRDRSLKVVTSPSSLSADDDDVTDDVTASTSCSVSDSLRHADAKYQCASDTSSSVPASSQRHWLTGEVTCVLKKIESVIAAAPSLDEKRRRVDDMLNELETIRRHLLMANSAAATAPLCVSVT